MPRFHLSVCALLLATVLCTGAGAVQLADNFNGTAINTSMWEVRGPNGISVYQNNELYVGGSNTSNIDWGATGGLRTNSYLPSEGLEVSVDMSASGHNYWAGMWINDGYNSVNFFTSGHLQPAGYTYVSNGTPVFNVWLANQPGTRYTMRYSSGLVKFFMDGQYLGQQAITLSSVKVGLEAAAALYGDPVNARFDNFTASTVPEPASLIGLICGLGSIGGMMLRRRR